MTKLLQGTTSKTFKGNLKGGIMLLVLTLLFSVHSNAQTPIAIGPQTSTFSSWVRGYYFTAPVNFTICGLYIPTDASTASQNVEVVRFTAGAPPAFPGTTNSFVSLFYQANYVPNTMIPCNINVNAGEVIGVYGARGSGQINSYDGTAYVTNILGNPVTLYRSGMQNSLATMQMNNIWAETTFSIGRIIMYINCCAPPVGPGTVSGNNTVCAGTTQTYTLGGVSGATNYNWTVPTGAVINSGQGNDTISVTFGTTSGNVCVAASNSCTTLGSVCQAVTVNQVPVASAGQDVSICTGGSTTLSASGGASYSWSPATGLSSTGISNPIASPTVTTTYTVTVNSNGCISTDSVMVTVNSLPVVTAGGDVVICSGNNTTLGAGGASSYTWNPSTGLSNPAISNPVASPTVTTTYIVVGTDVNGCMNSDTMMVTVSTPSVTASSNSAICIGDSTQISATSATAVSYAWSPGTGLSSTSISNPTAFPSSTTSYIITINDQYGCAASDTVMVSVNSLPNANAGQDMAICQGSGALLNATGGTSYSWGPASGLNSTSNSSPFANPSATTQYTVTITDNNGCMNIDSVIVTVNPLPPANAGPNATICTGSSVTLNASGGVSYSWAPPTGLSTTTGPTPNANPTTTTTYTVTVTDANGCVNTDAVTVTVSAPPLPDAGNNVFVCQGGSVTLAGTGGGTYSWSPGTGLSNTGISSPVASPTVTTTYTLTVTNAAGCTATDVVTVTVNSAPNATLASQNSTCGNDDGQITATPSGGAPPYMYSLNGGPGQTSATFTNLAPGSYTVTVTDTSGCFTTQTITVGQVLGVTASITATPMTGQVPLSVTFTNNSSGANNYYWDFGNGNNAITANASATYTASGTYQVILIAYNNNIACSDTAILIIIADDTMAVAIPNVFTPNGDGKNDFFKITSSGVHTIDLDIFDRWGAKVQSVSGDPAVTIWDGKTEGGAEAKDGVYYYVITATSANGKVSEHKGFIQLIRKK